MPDIGSLIIAGLGVFLTVLNIYDRIKNIKKDVGEPRRIIDERLKLLEVRVEEHERVIQAQNNNLEELKETCEVIQQVTLALLDFELSFCMRTDYEHTEDLEEAKRLLRSHLSSK